MNAENFSVVKESIRLNTIRKQIWDALKEGKHLDIVSAQDLCGTRDLRSNISVLRKRIDDLKEYWMEALA